MDNSLPNDVQNRLNKINWNHLKEKYGISKETIMKNPTVATQLAYGQMTVMDRLKVDPQVKQQTYRELCHQEKDGTYVEQKRPEVVPSFLHLNQNGDALVAVHHLIERLCKVAEGLFTLYLRRSLYKVFSSSMKKYGGSLSYQSSTASVMVNPALTARSSPVMAGIGSDQTENTFSPPVKVISTFNVIVMISGH